MNARPNLQVLPGLSESEPFVAFCGHCAHQPEISETQNRVCSSCHLGLIVTAPASLVPTRKEPFLLVDGRMQICAVSRRAEKVLGHAETEIVNRPVVEILVPADAEAAGIESLATTIVHAARGDGNVKDLVLRPVGEWGIRWFTRVGPCGANAALIVLAPEG